MRSSRALGWIALSIVLGAACRGDDESAGSGATGDDGSPDDGVDGGTAGTFGSGLADGSSEAGDSSGAAPPDLPDVAVCGDAILDAGEQCDDGNLDPADGCNTYCRITLASPSNVHNAGSARFLAIGVAPDGRVIAGGEEVFFGGGPPYETWLYWSHFNSDGDQLFGIDMPDGSVTDIYSVDEGDFRLIGVDSANRLRIGWDLYKAQWMQPIDGVFIDHEPPPKVFVDQAENVIAGYTQTREDGERVAVLDPTRGSPLDWIYDVPSEGEPQHVRGVVATQQGDMVVFGTAGESEDSMTSWITAVDYDGKERWMYRWPDQGWVGRDLALGPGGILWVLVDVYENGKPLPIVASVTPDGFPALQWPVPIFDDQSGQTAESLAVDHLGNLTLVGTTADPLISAGYVASLRENGTPRWAYMHDVALDFDVFARLHGVTAGPNGQVWVAGEVESQGYFEGWVITFQNPPG